MKRGSLATLWFAGIFSAATAGAMLNPEQESLKISKKLKPIDDERWSQIAGDRIKEKYKIAKGDTLFGISKQLFGDGKYWPKLWALNNATIANAHVILPNQELVFEPGTGMALPSATVSDAQSAEAPATSKKEKEDDSESDSEDNKIPHFTPGSDDWKKLPRQRWEDSTVQRKVEEIPSSIERSKEFNKKTSGMAPIVVASSSELDPIGRVKAVRSYAQTFNLGDLVFIEEKNGELQAGQRYAIVTRKPARIGSIFSGRKVYTYPVVAQVTIEGTKDGLHVGKITAVSGFGERGDIVIPLPTRWQLAPLKPGPSNISATVMIDQATSTYMVGTGRVVYLDRGESDGVENGMVFRIYERNDPNTEKRYTKSNFVPATNIVVVQTSERICVGYVTDTRNPVLDESEAVLLTNIEDVVNQRKFREKEVLFDGEESAAPSTEGAEEPGAAAKPEETAAPPKEDEELDEVETEKKLKKQEEDELDKATTPAPESAPKAEESLDQAEKSIEKTSPPSSNETPTDKATSPAIEEQNDTPQSSGESSSTPSSSPDSELDDVPE